MAAEIYEFAPVIPAGTAQTSPVTVPMVLPARVVRRIEIRVPPGPRGKIGFSIGAAKQPVIPANSGAWIVTDDEQIGWDVNTSITSGAWEFYGWNVGTFPHTVFVRMLVDLPQSSNTAAPAATPIEIAQLAPMTASDLAAITPQAPDLSTLPPDLVAAIRAAHPDGVAS